MNIKSLIVALSVLVISAPAFAEHTEKCKNQTIGRVLRAAAIGLTSGIASRSLADQAKSANLTAFTDHYYIASLIGQNVVNFVITGYDESQDCKHSKSPDNVACTDKKFFLETAASNLAFIVGAYGPEVFNALCTAGKIAANFLSHIDDKSLMRMQLTLMNMRISQLERK